MKVRIIGLIAVFMLAGILLMNVRMPLTNAASQTSINNAITKGLAYLNSTQQPDGSWGENATYSLNPVASTAMAVLAFENQGDYGWNASDPYSSTVQKGLNWLFTNGANISITSKPTGNPDTNGNGIGVAWESDGFPIYESPMVLMAIVGSNAPTNVTSTGPLGVRTYHDIAQDVVDYLAFAQNEPSSGTNRGGWGYTENSSSSDNSNTAWPILGLTAAKLWGINAPPFVASELNYWVLNCQDLTGDPTTNPPTTYSGYGSFGYDITDLILGGVAEAASGIAQLTYLGSSTTNSSIIAAEGYINGMWNLNESATSGWNVNIGNLYAMYAVMKACREATPTPIQYIANYNGTPGVEWYNGTGEYADSLVANQGPDGSWTNWNPWAESGGFSLDLSTAFGVLILEYVPVRVTYSLTVTVEDATNNSPIAGAAVQAVGPETHSGSTGINGQITFNSVQAGSYQVNASASGYLPSGTAVLLTSNTGLTLLLVPTNGTIRGWVTNATSSAIAGATITTNGTGVPSASINSSGYYAISVPPGTYNVTAGASGYMSNGPVTAPPVTSGATVTVNFTLTRAPAIPVGGEVEPVNTLVVLLAGVEATLSKYWVAFLAVGALAALLIFKKRRE